MDCSKDAAYLKRFLEKNYAYQLLARVNRNMIKYKYRSWEKRNVTLNKVIFIITSKEIRKRSYSNLALDSLSLNLIRF